MQQQIDQVRGEINEKIEHVNDNMNAQFAEIKSLVQQLSQREWNVSAKQLVNIEDDLFKRGSRLPAVIYKWALMVWCLKALD